MLDSFNYELAVAAALIIGLALSLEAGFGWGRKAVTKREDSAGGQIGAIQGAVLGLLGLLLSFSFAGAASRFMERQDLIVQEANAIGTAYLRADVLDEPYASQLRKTLAQYVQHRLETSKDLAAGLRSEDAAQIATFHTRLWEAARNGVLAKPTTMLAVVNPINDVIDLHSTRIAAGAKHLPALVLGLLMVCSVLSMTVIGYGCGLSNRRSLPMTLALALLIAAALWITIDLDHPRAGIIRLSDVPLKQLNLPGSP